MTTVVTNDNLQSHIKVLSLALAILETALHIVLSQFPTNLIKKLRFLFRIKFVTDFILNITQHSCIMPDDPVLNNFSSCAVAYFNVNST